MHEAWTYTSDFQSVSDPRWRCSARRSKLPRERPRPLETDERAATGDAGIGMSDSWRYRPSPASRVTSCGVVSTVGELITSLTNEAVTFDSERDIPSPPPSGSSCGPPPIGEDSPRGVPCNGRSMRDISPSSCILSLSRDSPRTAPAATSARDGSSPPSPPALSSSRIQWRSECGDGPPCLDTHPS